MYGFLLDHCTTLRKCWKFAYVLSRRSISEFYGVQRLFEKFAHTLGRPNNFSYKGY